MAMPASRQKQQVKDDFGLGVVAVGVLESADRADWGDTIEGESAWVACGKSNWVWTRHVDCRGVAFVEKRLVVSEKDRMLVPLSKMLEGSSDRAGEAYVGLDNIDARSSDTKEGEYCVRDAVTGRRSVWNYTGLPLAVAIRGMRRHLKIDK